MQEEAVRVGGAWPLLNQMNSGSIDFVYWAASTYEFNGETKQNKTKQLTAIIDNTRGDKANFESLLWFSK